MQVSSGEFYRRLILYLNIFFFLKDNNIFVRTQNKAIKKIDLNYSSENMCLNPTFKMKWMNNLRVYKNKYFFDITGFNQEKY